MPEYQEPDIVSDIVGRLRLLENKYSLYGERLLIINRNSLEEFRKLTREVKTLQQDLQEIKKEIEIIKETSKNIIREMQSLAKKENIKVLEKYINMWNPLTFVTEEEVKKLIEQEKMKNVENKRASSK